MFRHIFQTIKTENLQQTFVTRTRLLRRNARCYGITPAATIRKIMRVFIISEQ